ncbi:Fe3+/spermidine/putrescine ABC transporter ATP-binding protein [Mesorhizobium hungaricum]|jgi:spermidine/putrescine ABC transporter ATP-binding subunit|uniref:Spermidine/putrescine import ATP-binding protein PotA n=1 Tax=Mesorhizobium hungaricum TaxID=1566387 RepID=A0A1C2E3P2_9HYPH|nr:MULTISPECIES: ABC transporter ATP-binding protein [Mesorhizobium]MBN9235898.1 ABC transporter ATP-binding protein [Mesorhizobium sp.]OCX21555.1 Fe3+/spermidine/putrescine ABC transporter ATP-binding protein [Mesorhizobium hungaricum]
MTTDERFIQIEGVSKLFGALRAVHDISFTIRKGEFFSLLGPSGCGKTTLLRMLAGFEYPSLGEIYIDGQPMSAVAANKRPTNMVFQSYAIFPHLDVRENIAYGLKNRKMSASAIEEEVDRALELIMMPTYGHRRPHQLSGGQRQRVALARALVCKPKVLLLDEPLGALDKKLREEMQLELRQLQREVGITFVFVTHDQEEALTMSDRIAVMAKGRVLQIDTASQLYEEPLCKEVAGFIGSMNFIDGKVVSTTDENYIVEAGPLGRFCVARREGSVLRSSVTIAVRPEKITVSDTPVAPRGENVIKGKMTAHAYLGDRNHYYVDAGTGSKPIAVAKQNNVRTGRNEDLVGCDVWLSWKPESSILLPLTDGG